MLVLLETICVVLFLTAMLGCCATKRVEHTSCCAACRLQIQKIMLRISFWLSLILGVSSAAAGIAAIVVPKQAQSWAESALDS